MRTKTTRKQANPNGYQRQISQLAQEVAYGAKESAAISLKLHNSIIESNRALARIAERLERLEASAARDALPATTP